MPYPDLDAFVRDLEFVAFDTETTGLLPSVDRVLELAAVRFSLAGEIATFDELVTPGQAIGVGASRVHGIDEETVRDKPPIAEVLPRFSEFIRGSVLLAHNAEFDRSWLDGSIVQCPWICSYEDATWPRVPGETAGLTAIALAYDVGVSRAHRALED